MLIGSFLFIMFVVLTFATWYGRKTSSTSDFNVAGRNVVTILIMATTVASYVSDSTFLGFGALAYHNGMGVFIIAIAAAIALCIISLFLAGPLRSTGAVTLADFLAQRYESNFIRGLTGLVVFVLMICYVGAITIGGGLIIERITGMSYYWAAVIMMIFTLPYVILGGLKSVIRADAIQLCLMFLAVLIGLPVLLSQIGSGSITSGMSTMVETLHHQHWFNWSGTKDSPFALGTAINQVVVWGFGGAVLPHVITRVYSAKDERAAVLGTAWSAPIYLIIALLLILTLGATRVLLPNLVADQPFISMAADLLPPVLGGVILAGVIAAALSTISIQMVVGSQAFIYDFYKHIFNPAATDKTLLKFSRIATLIIGLIGLVLAIIQPSEIFWIVSFAVQLSGAAFFVPIVLGIYSKFGTRLGSITGMIAGLIVTILFALSGWTIPFMGMFSQPALLGVLSNLIVYVVISAVERSNKEFQQPGMALFIKMKGGHSIDDGV